MSKTIDTNLNVSPYFDDYASNSQHHRVLFKPSVPIQARELTQLQTILQSQIEKFGDVVVKEGSLVSGCSFNKVPINYVKLIDRDTDGNLYTVSDFANGFVRHESSNLIMQTVDTRAGFEITNPDLNTLYGDLVNTGNSGGVDKTNFAAGETIVFYPANGQLTNTFTISDGGTAYVNGETLVFTSTRGINATANVTTNSTGGVTSITLIQAGQDYKITDVPVITITTSTGSGANIIPTVNSTASLTIAGASFANSANNEYEPVSKTLRIKVSDGIIYQKGHFVDVNAQGLNVVPYKLNPSDMVVGFETTEEIVNSQSNSSLLDNSAGFNNENAPGADRLKLIPTLVSSTNAVAKAANNFLALMRIENGRVINVKEDTQFSRVGEELAKRTYEESGDYVTKPFSFFSQEFASEPDYDQITIGTGKAYIKGYRNELVASSKIFIRKGIDTANVENATVSQNYGNYIVVDEYLGSFDFNVGAAVKLLDTAGNRISTCPAGSAETVPTSNSATVVSASAPTYAGTIVGTARVRSVVYEDNVPGTSTGQYRLYLFDVQMNQGKNFADTRAVSYFTGSNAGVGFADIVLTNSRAVLQDTNLRRFVQSLGHTGIKTFNHKTNDIGTYTYRTVSTGIVQTNGSVTVTLTGNQIFDYTASGYLSTDQENEFIVVANNTSAQTAVLTGTVTATTSNSVTGSSTAFTTDFQVGDTIRITGSQDELITGITNSTHLNTLSAFTSAVSGAAYRRLLVADKPIHLQGSTTANVQISSDQKTATINLSRGKTLESTLAVVVNHNVQKREAVQKNKLLSANTYVKLNCATNADLAAGPWSLGIPDVYDINKVYVKYDNFTSIEAVAYDQTSQFELVRNQKDGFYDLSKLVLKSSSSNAVINSTARILVSARHFVNSGSGFGYYTVDSYPIDDVTVALPIDKIRTESIPVYSSPLDGEVIDLRNSVDFRSYAANTANTTNALTAGAASTNPVKTVSFSGEQYIAAPGKNMTVDYQHYLPRIDKIVMDQQGHLAITEGHPALRPTPPAENADVMTLAMVAVAMFPSLASKKARHAGRPDYGYKIINRQQRNFTMKDVGQISSEVKKLQYYTSLNLLEKAAVDLTIPSSANSSLTRFKNGILVDNFSDTSVAALLDREFKAGYDKPNRVMSTKTKSGIIDITPNTYSNTVRTGDMITLPFTHIPEFQQRSATRVRNTAELFWKFSGSVRLYPDYDNFMDTRHPPENDFHVEIDAGASTKSLVNNLQDISAIQEPRSRVTSDQSETSFVGESSRSFVSGVRSSRTGGGTSLFQTTTNETTQSFNTVRTIQSEESQNQFNVQEHSTTQNVGEFVRDIKFSPYIRDQFLYAHAVGLKPNTRHYVFFDLDEVTDQTRPCTIPEDTAVTEAAFRFTGLESDPITSNEFGEVFCCFHLPAETYAVGSRDLVIADRENVDQARAAMSTAAGTFNAYNFGVEKGSLQITTKHVTIGKSRVVTGTSSTSTSSRSERTNSSSQESVTGFTPDPPPVVFQPAWIPDIIEAMPAPPVQQPVPVRPPAPIRTPTPPTPTPPAPPPAPPVWEQQDMDGDGDGSDDGDPLAQTFIVKSPATGGGTKDQTGLMITKIDLYFETKDPVLGVTVQIRTCVNGFPAAEIMPGGNIHLRSSEVNTSADGTVATTVSFDYPVHLAVGQEYCFVLKPDASNPNYNVWVRRTGETDKTTGVALNKDEFEGMLFMSTNNRAWRPYQEEDIKFTIYRAEFNRGGGRVEYQNADHEFFTLNTINGNFDQGEKVFKYNNAANVTGNVSFSTTSETVTGTGTAFTANLAVGQAVALTNGTAHSVRNITAIANSTSLTVQGFPDFTSSAADIQLTPTGQVHYYEQTDQVKEMQLIKSTSTNSTFLFANTDVIIGSDSTANAIVTTVDDINVTAFDPMMYQISPPGTNIMMWQQANTATGQTANVAYPIDNRNTLKEVAKIKSLSNEIVSGLGKSWKQTFLLQTVSTALSPAIDDSISNILRIENVINNSNTSEHLPGQGNATAKYVSRSVTLDDGLDAEDLKIFLTATKPGTSQIEVYGRVANELESDAFIDVHWSKLKLVGTDKQTSIEINNDFHEYEYRIPDTPPSTALVGKGLADNANNIVATTDTQASALTAGDLVKIVNTSETIDYQIETVISANSTTITLGNNLSFDNTQCDMHRITTPQVAFKDPQNEFIATYYNSNQVKFDTFKVFQIKIVLLSDDASRVPKVSDFRALALSI